MSKMILKVLFIQRQERFPGQIAPEALCCVDEWTEIENPEWFSQECQKQLEQIAGDEIIGKQVIEIEVDQDKIRNILLNNSKIEGEIK